MSEQFTQPAPVDATPEGGKTVVARALKDDVRIPLFLGQTLINSLRDLGYNSNTSALYEHVDNALQWGGDGGPGLLPADRQAAEPTGRRLGVRQRQGDGPHVLKVATVFGGSMVFENRAGIGPYGMGMKAAALNVAGSVDVYSWQEPRAYYSMTLDVDEIDRDRNNMIELPDPQVSFTP